MHPDWRNRIFIISAAVVALIGGTQIAQGSFVWALILCGVAAMILLSRVQPVPIGALTLGVVTFGYIVGNRGFAQVSLIGTLPLFPAEVAFVVCMGVLLFKCAARRELPFRRDPLNIVILCWIAIGTIRIVFDFRVYGFVAVRDYALIYYAGFFFAAQYFGKDEVSRRFLVGCLYAASLTLLLLQPLYALFPDFFMQQLTVRDIPVIFYKGDLLATFLAIASLLFFLRFEVYRRPTYLVLSIIAVGLLHTTNNRASLLGLCVATIFLVVGKRWRFAALQVGGGAIAAVLIVLFAFAQGKNWESTPVFEFYERVASVVDPFDQRSYKGANTSYKGENNVFRTVWWKTAVGEAIEVNPWAGLGFGYDLAGRFIQTYYPASDDEFTVRSPHNIFVTVFARMGLIGLLPFLLMAALMVHGTLAALRAPASDYTPIALWCSAWIVFTSACFGVVLEGPMGAVVFWTVLGLAHHFTAGSEAIESGTAGMPDSAVTPTRGA